MTNNNDLILTKLGLIIGSVTATMTLASVDLILAICLKSISIISFTIVIALNLEKFVELLKKWFG